MKNLWTGDPLAKLPKTVVGLGVIMLIFLAFWLRVNKLTQSPPGVYLDEASSAYNAYSILKTGKDEHGVAWPLFFRAFGEYRSGLFIYSLAPLIKLGGLNIETVRLGSAIWGTATVAILFWFSWLISSNLAFSFLAGLILTLMPWQIHFSRMAYEVITLPFFLIAICALSIKWVKTEKTWLGWLLALTIFGSFFTYQTAKLWTPLLTIMTLFFFRDKIKKNSRLIWPWLTGLNLILLTAIIWERNFPGSLMARMNGLAIWRDQPTLIELGTRFVANYFKHWQWQFLFKTGDLTYRSSSGISSEMLTTWAVFLVIGLGVTIKYLRNKPEGKIILAMMATFPVAAALTMTGPHAIRTFQAGPFFALVIALGIWWCFKKLSNKKVKYIFIGLLTMATGLEFNHYYQDLIYQYPQRVWMPQHGFDGDLAKLLPQAYKMSLAEEKLLFLSNQIEQGYIQGLFFTQAEPKIWQEKNQAEFRIEAPTMPLKKGIWLLTRAECRQYQIATEQNYCLTNQ